MHQDRPITIDAKIGQKQVILESDARRFIGFIVEENLDWQLAEEDIGFIILGCSPVSVHDRTAYSQTENQEKIWALIESPDRKIMKRSCQLSKKEKFSEN